MELRKQGGGGAGFCDRREFAPAVGNAKEPGVFVHAPCFTVVENVEGSVGPEDHVGWSADFHGLSGAVFSLTDLDGIGEGFEFGEASLVIEAHPVEGRALPVEVESGFVKVLGEAAGVFEFGFEVKDRSAAGGSAAGVELGKLIDLCMRVIDEGVRDRRKFFETGIVGAFIERAFRVEGVA